MFDALKRSKLNQGIPAIAVVSGGTALPTAFRLGAQFVITKPASLDQVRHTLRAASSKMKKEAGAAVSTPTTPVPARAHAAAASAAPAASGMHSSDAASPVSSQSAPSGVSSRAVNLKADSPSACSIGGIRRGACARHNTRHFAETRRLCSADARKEIYAQSRLGRSDACRSRRSRESGWLFSASIYTAQTEASHADRGVHLRHDHAHRCRHILRVDDAS